VHLESFKLAEKNKIRVMLDGTDGDSTVSHGYEAFGQLASSGRILAMFRHAQMLKANMPQEAHSLQNLAFRRGLDLIIPAPLQKPWHTLTGRGRTVQKAPRTEFDRLQWHVISKDFKQAQRLEERYIEFFEKTRTSDRGPIVSHWNDLTSGHYARILEIAELMSQAYGLEMRFPFFDQRLIEFCIAVPSLEKIHGGWTRSVFRHAMEGIIPPEVQWRTTKADLGPGLKRNLLKFSVQRIEATIDDRNSMMARYLDIDFLKRIYRRFLAEPFKSDYDCLILIGVVHLAEWLGHTKFY
jgi:asparagine synthase (glutamine-hydrolysing)